VEVDQSRNRQTSRSGALQGESAVLSARPHHCVWTAHGSYTLGRAGLVQILEEIVRSELDLFMTPLSGSIVAGDEPGPVHSTEVSVDKRVPALRFVARVVVETEMPLGVLVP